MRNTLLSGLARTGFLVHINSWHKPPGTESLSLVHPCCNWTRKVLPLGGVVLDQLMYQLIKPGLCHAFEMYTTKVTHRRVQTGGNTEYGSMHSIPVYMENHCFSRISPCGHNVVPIFYHWLKAFDSGLYEKGEHMKFKNWLTVTLVLLAHHASPASRVIAFLSPFPCADGSVQQNKRWIF